MVRRHWRRSQRCLQRQLVLVQLSQIDKLRKSAAVSQFQQLTLSIENGNRHYAHVDCPGHADYVRHDYRCGRWTALFWLFLQLMVQCLRPASCIAGPSGRCAVIGCFHEWLTSWRWRIAGTRRNGNSGVVVFIWFSWRWHSNCQRFSSSAEDSNETTGKAAILELMEAVDAYIPQPGVLKISRSWCRLGCIFNFRSWHGCNWPYWARHCKCWWRDWDCWP